MQNETPFNLIVWESPETLPFPSEIKPLLTNINWQEHEWHTSGLPVPFAKYSISGKSLYLTELQSGDIKIEKEEEFTGTIVVSSFFVDEIDNEGHNYFVHFKVTILKGEVVEVVLYKTEKQPVGEYKLAMKDFNDNIRKVMITSNSWWYKWLYRPWYIVVRCGGFILCWLLHWVMVGISAIVQFLTPL